MTVNNPALPLGALVLVAEPRRGEDRSDSGRRCCHRTNYLMLASRQSGCRRLLFAAPHLVLRPFWTWAWTLGETCPRRAYGRDPKRHDLRGSPLSILLPDRSHRESGSGPREYAANRRYRTGTPHEDANLRQGHPWQGKLELIPRDHRPEIRTRQRSLARTK